MSWAGDAMGLLCLACIIGYLMKIERNIKFLADTLRKDRGIKSDD